MSRARILVVAAVIGVLAALLGWQFQRGRLAGRCEAEGGVWDGRASTCRTPPAGPIIERDGLRRT